MRNSAWKIRLKFKLLAPFYDLFELILLLDQRRSPRRALADKIPNEPLRILDTCVGTANGSITIAEANDQNDIIGIDLSPDMIAIAEKKIQRKGIKNLSILQMDATKMDFEDGEFDVVMVSFGLHEHDYELMIDMLKEMRRVLKEKGTLFIVDYERENGTLKKIAFSIHLRLFEPRHMSQFLKYDWSQILQGNSFTDIEIDKCLFSKMISAVAS